MGLRERKKQQTRDALVEAAARLFAEQGYDRTTVADVAAAAGVSTRTFFSYFRAKEDVLFAGTDRRLQAIGEAFDAVAARGSGSPLQTVQHLLEHVLEHVLASSDDDDLAGPDRIAVMLARPELQALALQRLAAAPRLIAGRLRQAYPDRLDDTLAHATSGALVGALVGALLSGIAQGEPPPALRERMRRALALLEDGLRTLA